VRRGLENSRLDFGGNLDPFLCFALIFYPIMYFQLDSNSLLLFARWQH